MSHVKCCGKVVYTHTAGNSSLTAQPRHQLYWLAIAMVVNPGQYYSSTSKYIVTTPFYILSNLLFIIILSFFAALPTWLMNCHLDEVTD